MSYFCNIKINVLNRRTKKNNMKKYFVNGKQITEIEAKVIEARNREYMNSGDWSQIAKCEFIVII